MALTLLLLGGLFLVGLAADEIGRRTRLPRVTLLLACGIVAGQSGFDLIPRNLQLWYDLLSALALTMVAFLLGGALTSEAVRGLGRSVVTLSLVIVLGTVAGVASGLWLLGVDPALALMLGAIAAATDPAATEDAVRQSGQRGRFPDSLKAVVAIDDAWGMIAFSLIVVQASVMTQGGLAWDMVVTASWDIVGALVLGLLIGLPAAALTGRVQPGEPLLSEALGLVCLTAGLALWLEVSFLLCGMVVGLVIAKRARHHERAFHEIEHIHWPFLILFFVLAGASLNLTALLAAGGIGAAYVLARLLARVIAGWAGGKLVGLPPRQQAWIGIALLPQAGVAVGMALVAAQRFPQYGELLLQLAIGSTVIFELIGPVLTMWAIRRVSDGET